MENTKIEWATHTFNPLEGCQKVGPGCDHCYAETRNARFGGGVAPNWGPSAPRRRTSNANWRKPLAWQADAKRTGIRPRVFCASLADVFDNAVPEDWRTDLWELIASTPNLDWLLLTKRIANVKNMLPVMDSTKSGYRPWNEQWPWPNVWIGATIVNQVEADRDVPKLLATDAAVRFLSIEPLLGPVDLTEVSDCTSALDPECWGDCRCDALYGFDAGCRWNGGDGTLRRKIDWVIVGGESGPGARPMHPDWARSLRDQCASAGVPFLFKQWGEWEVSLDRDRDDPDCRADYTNDYVDHGKSCWLNLRGGSGFHGDRFHVMRRVGKHTSGRLLDGIEHNAMPDPSDHRGYGV